MGPPYRHLLKSLQELLSHTLSAEEFRLRHRWDALDAEDKAFAAILSHLDHYLDDDDIRSREAAYREMQEAEMRVLITALEAGDLKRALRVTFLSRSSNS